MNIYYDTEFIDDGRTIDLISIGMVDENGKTYYAISGEFDMNKLLENQWLAENVAIHLPMYDGIHLNLAHKDVKNRATIKNEVQRFIQDRSNPALWAWYGAYDQVALCQLFGKITDVPQGIPTRTNDLKQEVQRLGNPKLPMQSLESQHNALADALWVKHCHSWIMEEAI